VFVFDDQDRGSHGPMLHRGGSQAVVRYAGFRAPREGHVGEPQPVTNTTHIDPNVEVLLNGNRSRDTRRPAP
jgi:hypothetical protein